MSNIRIVFGSIADLATLSDPYADFQASYPVAFLQDRRRIFSAITAAAAPTAWKTIRMVWTTAQEINTVALLRTSLPAATSQYEFRCWTGNDFATGLIGTDTGSFPNLTGSAELFDKVLWTAALRSGVLSAELKVKDTAGVGVIELGRLFVGSYWSPAYNFSYPPEIGWEDTSQQSRTAGGSVRVNIGAQYRVQRFQFNNLSKSEGTALLAASRAVGKGGEVLVSMWPGDGSSMEIDGLMSGVMPKLPTVVKNYANVFAAGLGIEES